MKKYILFFVLICASFAAKAQGGFNYYEWGAGITASYMRGYDDLVKQVYHPGAGITVVYNYSPYVPMALDYQFGTLEGGGRTPDKDQYGRYSKNKFQDLVLHADMQLGEIIDYGDNSFLNIVKNFYVGTGVGAVSNNIVDIQRYNLFPQNGATGPTATEGFQGRDKSIDLLIPIRLGYEFKFFDSYDQVAYTLTLGYQHNITFGEGLDGYNDPAGKFKNNAPDQFAQFTIGFKYNFGNTVSYTKLVRRFQY